MGETPASGDFRDRAITVFALAQLHVHSAELDFTQVLSGRETHVGTKPFLQASDTDPRMCSHLADGQIVKGLLLTQ